MKLVGYIHLYYGEGKGKTTAALGMILRAAGHGWPVLLVQLLKGRATGELSALAQLPQVTILRGKEGQRFTFQMNEQELAETRRLHDEHLRQAEAWLKHEPGPCLLVLDEAIGAYQKGLVDRALLLRLLDTRPAGAEIVLTGRYPAAELLQRAHYASEIVKRRHPYEEGQSAREGIEF